MFSKLIFKNKELCNFAKKESVKILFYLYVELRENTKKECNFTKIVL